MILHTHPCGDGSIDHSHGGNRPDMPHTHVSEGLGMSMTVDLIPVYVPPLEDWWRDLAESDLLATVPKMQEYGALDLEAIGRDMARMANWTDDDLTRADYIEMGIAFYLRGKIARIMEAYALHRKPSDDTWKDCTVYSMMGRAARERGGWGDVV